MKKSIYTVFAFAVFAASAFAAQSTELDVKVPFSFKAGSLTLPAGAYKVVETSPGVLLIRGEKVAVFVSGILLGSVDGAKPRFLFNHAAEGYVLSGVASTK